MRILSLAALLTGSLMLATSCAPVMPAGPAQTPLGFGVQAKKNVCCFVTGGGFIEYVITVDPKVTFGFNATQFNDGTATGEVEVVDHGTGDNFHASTITSVTCRTIGNDVEYTILGDLAQQSSGYPGTCQVIVRDNGEPGNTNSGKGTDTFDFTVTSGSLSGYNRAGALAGGNIQAHVY